MDAVQDIPCQVTQAQADSALLKLRALVKVPEDAVASPSPACGMVAIGPIAGAFGYTTLTGKHLFLGILFDAQSGKALDGGLEGTSSEPSAD